MVIIMTLWMGNGAVVTVVRPLMRPETLPLKNFSET